MRKDTQRRIDIYTERIPHIKEKLGAAGMGLLIAAIVATSATFAWITLSRAPEVKNISTNLSDGRKFQRLMIAQDTVSCVALGTGKALDNLDSLDEKARR